MERETCDKVRLVSLMFLGHNTFYSYMNPIL